MIFKKAEDIPMVEEVMGRLVELPKIPSVVGCKDDLQEGGRSSDDLRGYGVDLWNYLKFLV